VVLRLHADFTQQPSPKFEKAIEPDQLLALFQYNEAEHARNGAVAVYPVSGDSLIGGDSSPKLVGLGIN
jgi:hypothetical protein